MLDFIKSNKYILIVVVLIAIGFGWYGLSEPQNEALLASETVDGAQSAAEREVVNTLLQLRSIELDGQIFVDPAFGSLRDFTTDIVSEPRGRRNPFAPLSDPGVETLSPTEAQN